MIVFVESNFVLELALRQSEVQAAQSLLELAESGKIDVRIPAVSLIEPRYKLAQTASDHRRLRDAIDKQLKQMVRSAGFVDLEAKSSDLMGALATKADLDIREFEAVTRRVLDCAKILPLTHEVLWAGMRRQLLDLEPMDALVFASVEASLQDAAVGESVFANRDAKGFLSKTVVDDLEKRRCRVIPNFSRSLEYVRKRI
jgi:predicted nucleic acid-binding protein